MENENNPRPRLLKGDVPAEGTKTGVKASVTAEMAALHTIGTYVDAAAEAMRTGKPVNRDLGEDSN